MFVNQHHEYFRNAHTYVHFDAPVDLPTGTKKVILFAYLLGKVHTYVHFERVLPPLVNFTTR